MIRSQIVLRETLRVFFSDDVIEGVVVVECEEPLVINSLTVLFDGSLNYEIRHGQRINTIWVLCFKFFSRVMKKFS